jgi:hypothetical protein
MPSFGVSSRAIDPAPAPRRTKPDRHAQLRNTDPCLRDSGGDPRDLASAADDHADRQREVPLDRLLEQRVEPRRVSFGAPAEDVSARDVGRDVVEPEPLDALTQRRHPDERLSADVDPAEQGDVRHLGLP